MQVYFTTPIYVSLFDPRHLRRERTLPGEVTCLYLHSVVSVPTSRSTPPTRQTHTQKKRKSKRGICLILERKMARRGGSALAVNEDRRWRGQLRGRSGESDELRCQGALDEHPRSQLACLPNKALDQERAACKPRDIELPIRCILLRA